VGFCGIHSEISARKAKARRKTRMTQQVTTLATAQQQWHASRRASAWRARSTDKVGKRTVEPAPAVDGRPARLEFTIENDPARTQADSSLNCVIDELSSLSAL
jgi:hypothetical protein